MRKLLLNVPVLLVVVIVAVTLSIHQDMGNASWLWFQRSGSLIVLLGAVLGYRSVVRLGLRGVGGAPVSFARATLVSMDDSAPQRKVKVAYSEDTKRQFSEHTLDQKAGWLGAWLLVFGTIVRGYGDLLGLLFYSR